MLVLTNSMQHFFAMRGPCNFSPNQSFMPQYQKGLRMVTARHNAALKKQCKTVSSLKWKLVFMSHACPRITWPLAKLMWTCFSTQCDPWVYSVHETGIMKWYLRESISKVKWLRRFPHKLPSYLLMATCNFMTSPQAGAPTKPVPTLLSVLSKEPMLRGFS